MLADGSNSYAWNARNQLAGLSGANLGIFMYDGLGRRAAKSIDGVTTQLLHDGLNPVQELSSAGTPTANLLTGLSIDEFFMRTDSAGARSYLTDILGSAVALSDSGGAIGTTYSYEPFGKVTPGGAPRTNPFQFTGRENDGTGLYYYRARYYSPGLQRFIAQDPIGFLGGDANLYGYVRNNPIIRRDETGEGPLAGVAVGTACAAYTIYGHYSNLTELNKLSREIQQASQQMQDLRQQQNDCRDPVQQVQLEEQIRQIQQQNIKLIRQYTQQHFADSFSDAANVAACVLAARLGFLSPLP